MGLTLAEQQEAIDLLKLAKQSIRALGGKHSITSTEMRIEEFLLTVEPANTPENDPFVEGEKEFWE